MNNNIRIHYLRRPSNVGHKGEPVAVIASRIGLQNGVAFIKFAVATVHPGDKFIKSRGRTIALERLDGVDGRGKKKDGRKNGASYMTPSASNDLTKAVTEKNGHLLTKILMKEIFADTYYPKHVRELAGDWLAFYSESDDARKTIPVPRSGLERFESDAPPAPAPDYRGLTNGEIAARQKTILPPSHIKGDFGMLDERAFGKRNLPRA